MAVSRSIIAAVAALHLAAAQQPEQAHLAVTGKAGEMSLDFMAHDASLNCTGWGAQISTDPTFSEGEFVPSYACTDFTASEPGNTYAVRVLFTNLVVGQTYYYVCGSELSRAPWSQVFSFTYGSGAVRAGGPVYAVLADFGYYNAESLGKLIEYSELDMFDYLLHAGDFAYDFDADKGSVGDGYMRQLQPVIGFKPYMGIQGNHEDGSNYTHWKTRFASTAENAGVNSGSGTNMFYSFVDGLTHFLMWDSEAFWSQPVDSQTAMINWITADIAAANADRATVPWLISLAHKGWWMDDTLQCPSGAGCVVWKLLVEGGVDLYLMGHIHYYERNLPQYPNANNGSGVVDTNCSSPNLGNATNTVAVYTDCAYMTTIVCAAPGDQEVNRRLHAHTTAVGAPQIGVTGTNNYGFALLNVINETTLHWSFTTAIPHVNSSNPTYSDDLWLVVHSHGARTNLPPV